MNNEDDEQPRMMPGEKPYTREEHDRLQVRLTAAVAATEQFSEDELEDDAAKLLLSQLPEKTPDGVPYTLATVRAALAE